MSKPPRGGDLTTEAIARLLASAIESADSGVASAQSGWTALTSEELAKLRRVLPQGTLESRSDGTARIVIGGVSAIFQLREVLPEFGHQFEYLLDSKTQTSRDIARGEDASKILTSAVRQAKRSVASLAHLVFLGWWRMIESNGIEAPLNRVLAEGFSPKSWTQASARSATGLGLSVAQTATGVLPTEAGALRQLGELPGCDKISLSFEHSQEPDLIRVKRVLEWERFANEVPKEVAVAIGFGWSVRLAWDGSGSIPLDTRRCSDLSNRLDGSLAELAKSGEIQFETTVKQLESNGFPWATSIVTWPHIT